MASNFPKLIRGLKFKLSDTTLTSDVNQTLSNLLSQSNKNKKTIATVATVANNANVRSVSPSLALEGLTDVVITAVLNGQTIVWNGTNWVNSTIGIVAGSPIIALPSSGPGGGSLNAINIGVTNSVVVCVPGRCLQYSPKKWTMTISVNSATVQVVSMNIAQCTQDTGVVISSTPITFAGLAAPLLSSGLNTSDVISLFLDPTFDYFVRLRISTGGLMNDILPLSGSLCTNTYTASADIQASNPIVLSGGTAHASQSLIISWVAA